MGRMGGPSPNSVYFSVQLSTDEAAVLEKAVKASGTNRNAFIRLWIKTLAKKK
jgi:hypothetical protein